jgi:hypothetical protein
LKTFGGWRDRQLADGTVVWTAQTIAAARKHNRITCGDRLLPSKARATDPLCPWVNDAREPEELPQDWVPAEPLPDDPPF